MCIQIALVTEQKKGTFNRYLKDPYKFDQRVQEISRKKEYVWKGEALEDEYRLIKTLKKFLYNDIPFTDYLMDHLEKLTFKYLT